MDIKKLNAEFKEMLKYTIDDDDDLTNYIFEGIAYIEDLTGTEIDFEKNLVAKTILRNYVRYSVNNATEYFEENFGKEIMRLQLTEGVGQLDK